MSRAIKKIAATSAIALVAGLAVTGSGGTATAAAGGFCEGMSAPQNNDVANQAPVVVNDTAKVVAGTTVIIKVLANDSDPDADKLYVENASTPKKGEVCVEKNGTIEYYARGSRYNYTDTFTYGVTDGDRYRTGTVTVSVEGVKPVRPVLKQKLVVKHGKVKQRARVSFTNTNTYRVVLLAGSPKKETAVGPACPLPEPHLRVRHQAEASRLPGDPRPEGQGAQLHQLRLPEHP